MKKIYFYLFLVALFVPIHMSKAVTIDTTATYLLRCAQWPTGCIVLGAEHSSTIPILYALESKGTADSYWQFEEKSTGKYAIRNTKSQQYLQYTTVRVENATKGLKLATTADTDSALWTIKDFGANVQIINVAVPTQSINVRTDGTYLVGTFTTATTNNALFTLETTSGVSNSSTDLSAYIDSLQFNGIPAVYDEFTQKYILPIPTAFRGKDVYKALVTYVPRMLTSDWAITFDGQTLADSVTFAAPIATTEHTLTIQHGEEKFSATLVGNFLPVVELTTAPGINGQTYTEGAIRVIDADGTSDSQRFKANVRYRGATAQTQEKKAFAVKLIDDAGEDVDGTFFNLRSDNNWILDAMAIDVARMRNRVSTDLWNAYSTAPYQKVSEKKALNGTRGHFVEVILNGRYQGIYCMTERIDRKQLRAKKFTTDTLGNVTVKGLLYKADQWHYNVFMGHEAGQNFYPGVAPVRYNNGSDVWGGFEMSYPEVADGEQVDWKPLYDAVSAVASNDTAAFARNAANLFDLPVALDYYLFVDLMLATDNHGKNMIYYIYDQTASKKLGITPWDLDGTWGRDWYGRDYKSNPAQDFISFLWKYEHGEHTLFKRLRETPSFDWARQLKERYAALRQTHFATESLIKRFTDYGDLFVESGAHLRERARWDGSNGRTIDIPSEMTYISNWIPRRVAYLDKQYGYDPLLGLAKTLTDAGDQLTVTGAKGAIIINAAHAQDIKVFDVAGKRVATQRVSAGLSQIGGLTSGIYIVNKQKVVVE